MINKIYGQTSINIEPNSNFNLYAYTNISDLSNNTIKWFTDIDMENQIGSGSTIELSSSCFNNGDIIYVNVFSNSTDQKLCDESLLIQLNITDIYNGIPVRNINIEAVDLDSVYFKYHKAFSGICYMYIRDTDNIYEQNEFVSDTPASGSYNMYTEYDIIDEFFSNSHEAEIAYGQNIDLNKSYTMLDNVRLNIGTKVLLYRQKNLKENGLYIVNSNNELVFQDQFNDVSKMFRYKIHINAGSHLDDEFHIVGYITVN